MRISRWDSYFDGTFAERAMLRDQTAGTIDTFISQVELRPHNAEGVALEVPQETLFLMRFCQRLVWHYVISNPKLATQQAGQRRVISELFGIYADCVAAARHTPSARSLIPPRFRHRVDELAEQDSPERIAIDIVASFTDAQALAMHQRLTGIAPGSLTDILEG